VEVDGTPEGIWQKRQVDGGRPLLARIEELLPCTLLKVPDGFLCNAILEVGIDPTKVSRCPLALQLFLKALSATRPLSQW
jgi:hypothetical protein